MIPHLVKTLENKDIFSEKLKAGIIWSIGLLFNTEPSIIEKRTHKMIKEMEKKATEMRNDKINNFVKNLQIYFNTWPANIDVYIKRANKAIKNRSFDPLGNEQEVNKMFISRCGLIGGGLKQCH